MGANSADLRFPCQITLSLCRVAPSANRTADRNDPKKQPAFDKWLRHWPAWLLMPTSVQIAPFLPMNGRAKARNYLLSLVHPPFHFPRIQRPGPFPAACQSRPCPTFLRHRVMQGNDPPRTGQKGTQEDRICGAVPAAGPKMRRTKRTSARNLPASFVGTFSVIFPAS